MELKNTLKYRNIWMGLVMIWVVLYHSEIAFSNAVLQTIKEVGYGGVDFFLFASGLGCYLSFKKDTDIKNFIKRRVLKIMPTYLAYIPFWLIFMWLLYRIPAQAMIGNIFGIQFFTGNEFAFNWYIGAMWIFYILTPYFVWAVDAANTWKKCALVVLTLLVFSISIWNVKVFIIAVTRFPIFFLGMFFAKLSQNNEMLNRKKILALFSASIVGGILLVYFRMAYGEKLWSHGLYWYPFILITPGICIAISLAAKVLENTRLGKVILKFIGVIGNYTFEMYLMHILIFDVYRHYFIERGILVNRKEYWFLMVFVIVPLGSIMFHLWVDFIKKNVKKYKKLPITTLLLLTAGIFTACGQDKPIATDNQANAKVEATLTPMQKPTIDELKEMFGESCIPEQTFEVELSEYDGRVYFVPFAPSEENPEFQIQLMQAGEVLDDIVVYVPEELEGEGFSSLDAVSFFDVNYDDNTDIITVQTYGGTTFAAVYYGFAADAEDYDRYFWCQEELSANVTSQVEEIAIPQIREFLTDGKENGEFASYQEAYEARSRLSQLENSDTEYDLIYFDEDEIPELVAGDSGYFTSLYTYNDGKLYTLMDSWPYGAMGNLGYEYSPRKNSLRNYNNDYAGAVTYTTYMTVGPQYSMDTVVQIETYNFDDANGNGIPDENEQDSMGVYNTSYIEGVEVTTEECNSYDAGNYEYIEGKMDIETLKAMLEEN